MIKTIKEALNFHKHYSNCNLSQNQINIPSTLPVCASLDTPATDSDKLGKSRGNNHFINSFT